MFLLLYDAELILFLPTMFNVWNISIFEAVPLVMILLVIVITCLYDVEHDAIIYNT